MFRSLLTWGAIVAIGGFVFAADPATRGVEDSRDRPAENVLQGEFERQDAILMSWDPADRWTRESVVDILGVVQRRAPIVLLVADDAVQRSAERTLRRAGVALDGIRFVRMPYDTVWSRDYGPQFVKGTDGKYRFLDATYAHRAHTRDDSVPAALASLLGLELVPAPINLDGGNLLGNGAGIIVTTRLTVELNADRGLDEGKVAEILRRHLGGTDVVVLEPLAGEPTGHVDMFAAFTSPTKVVVGSYSRRFDAANADVLDRNAAALAKLSTPERPLEVVRIRMPPHDAGGWRTHTNVLFVNGAVLMPVFPGFDRGSRGAALAAFRGLLPDWEIIPIDCNRLIAQGGAIHCVTSGLGSLPRLPLSHEAARAQARLPLVRSVGRPSRPPETRNAAR